MKKMENVSLKASTPKWILDGFSGTLTFLLLGCKGVIMLYLSKIPKIKTIH